MASSLDSLLSTAKNIVTALSSIQQAILRGQGNITSPTKVGAGPHQVFVGSGYLVRMSMVATANNQYWNVYDAGSAADIVPENLMCNINFSSTLADGVVDIGMVFSKGLAIVQDGSQASNVTYYTS
jgi:hypothetical protein